VYRCTITIVFQPPSSFRVRQLVSSGRCRIACSARRSVTRRRFNPTARSSLYARLTLSLQIVISSSLAGTSPTTSRWEQERSEANEFLQVLRNQIQNADATVTDFNVGVNCGETAGQTVMHAHIHLIPRRQGDMPNARGGVRGVIPEKMPYWPRASTSRSRVDVRAGPIRVVPQVRQEFVYGFLSTDVPAATEDLHFQGSVENTWISYRRSGTDTQIMTVSSRERASV
jgi:diadenosine tetraphosphate (Ap4A) HIT family hydrolase